MEKLDKEYCRTVLEKFLSYPLTSTNNLLDEFIKLPNAIYKLDGGKKNFVYIPGTRKDRVVLVAHADTVWDSYYYEDELCENILSYKKGKYFNLSKKYGLGADDRAGCAILWILKDMGHSLLILDGEEHGQIGANHLKKEYPDIFNEINNHNHIIQFDRRGNKDYKTYDIPVSNEYIKFIKKNTKYRCPGNNSRTDIVVLCEKVCGVNLSVGYYNEHYSSEYLVFKDWYKTLKLSYKMLSKQQDKFIIE